MYIARILYPVKTLGPGERIGIWFSGCEHYCSGCSNPELWEQPERLKVNEQSVLKIVARISEEHRVDGFTLSGGDPFYQPDALRELLPDLNKLSQDILVYTGYLYKDILRSYPELLSQIAVLIDGPYIEKRNRQEVLRGSDNQEIIVLKQEYKGLYDEYRKMKSSPIQNFTTATGVASVGIHRRGYHQELEQRLEKKGLVTSNGKKK